MFSKLFSMHSRQALALIFLLLLAPAAVAQEVYTLSGRVLDRESGETLIGATVLVPALETGATTNAYGFYSLTLPAGDSILLQVSYVGYRTRELYLEMRADRQFEIELATGIDLEEVVVKANSFEQQLNSTEMSVEAISTREAKMVPVLLGESDILKTIQLKPGIPSGSEGATGLFVRGGGSDQNLIVLDEAVVYNASHLFGFFSTFNTDAVKDLKIYKGGFPAQYGGRLSSVIDVKLKEGNRKQFAGSGGIGLIASRLTLEGPIQQERSSFIVSGRRTYVDLLTRAVNRANEGEEDYNPIPDYYFYDLNAKANFELGKNDRLFLSGYFGRDVFGFDNDFLNFDFDWGNATGTLRWNHIFSPKLFANTTFTYSDYQYNINNDITGFSFNVGSDIRDTNFKSDFLFAPGNRHTISFGFSLTHHDFTVGRLKAGSDDGVVSFSAGNDFSAFEYGLYFSDDVQLSPALQLNAGLRVSGFYNDGKSYTGLEPRLAARYRAGERLSIKGSYARMYQYLHLVANSGISLPTDIWYPSTGRVAPQRSDQVALGFSYLLLPELFLNVETYYKQLDNQLEFVDGARLFANDELEQEFAVGRGEAYGLEVSLEKKEGRLTGWIGYTLARVRRGDFEPIDPGGYFEQNRFSRFFQPIYDRRHDLSVVALYELGRTTLTATFVYGSGDLRWLPNGRFSLQDVQGAGFESVIPVYQGRNNYRLPSYQRLDLGATYHFKPKWGESDLTLTIINVYNRRNTFFIYLQPEYRELVDDNGNLIEVPARISARQVSLFPVLPSLSWNFKF